MNCSKILYISSCILFTFTSVYSQVSESDISVFGYFQNTFEQQEFKDNSLDLNSFIMQQMNIFFQKDLAANWSALINFEILNTFSSGRNWGAFNLEEAWVRYRDSNQFNLKLGLQIPIFNNLNEIKNRTPLLPYIIRPLVYETSYKEIISVEEYTPARAFIQAYGFIPSQDLKIDWAAYVGNSPNINTLSEFGITGLDTTTALLIGGRLGIRYLNLKLGVSASRDRSNQFKGAEKEIGGPASRYENIPRVRYGSDFSYEYDDFDITAEFIKVEYRRHIAGTELDKEFYYITVGCQCSSQLYVYLSYWQTMEQFLDTIFRVTVPNLGAQFRLNDRITFKTHFAPVELHSTNRAVYHTQTFQFYSAAVSVFF